MGDADQRHQISPPRQAVVQEAARRCLGSRLQPLALKVGLGQLSHIGQVKQVDL